MPLPDKFKMNSSLQAFSNINYILSNAIQNQLIDPVSAAQIKNTMSQIQTAQQSPGQNADLQPLFDKLQGQLQSPAFQNIPGALQNPAIDSFLSSGPFTNPSSPFSLSSQADRQGNVTLVDKDGGGTIYNGPLTGLQNFMSQNPGWADLGTVNGIPLKSFSDASTYGITPPAAPTVPQPTPIPPTGPTGTGTGTPPPTGAGGPTGTGTGTVPTGPLPPTGYAPPDPTGLSNPPTLPTPGTPVTTPVNQPTVPATDISPFIPATSSQQQDILNQYITQSQGLASQNLGQLQSLIGPYIQEQFSQYTDPNNPAGAQLRGDLNNVGMLDSGAFPQALASRLAPLISQGALQLGEQTLIPSFANQQDLIGQEAGVQSNLGLDPLQRFVEEQNFKQQSDLANQLAQQGASAQFGSGIGGLLGGGLGAGAGALLAPTGYGAIGALIGSQIGSQGGSAAGGSGMTWICTHLKKLGLATESEVEAVHGMLYPTILTHPLDWIRYFLGAPYLIRLADQAGTDWEAVKAVLVDQVLQADSSEHGFVIYRDEVHRLCERYAPQLWTEELC